MLSIEKLRIVLKTAHDCVGSKEFCVKELALPADVFTLFAAFALCCIGLIFGTISTFLIFLATGAAFAIAGGAGVFAIELGSCNESKVYLYTFMTETVIIGVVGTILGHPEACVPFSVMFLTWLWNGISFASGNTKFLESFARQMNAGGGISPREWPH